MANDLQLLQDLNRNYIRSVQESDVRWFDAHLSEDFLNSNPAVGRGTGFAPRTAGTGAPAPGIGAATPASTGVRRR